ncbi:MAG: hypothetical protein ACTSU2_13400 [Promethearchaeota archaeon]
MKKRNTRVPLDEKIDTQNELSRVEKERDKSLEKSNDNEPLQKSEIQNDDKTLNDQKEGKENKNNVISLFDVATLVSEKPVLYTIQKLRKGPIRKSTLEKLLKARFSSMKLNPEDVLNKLIKNKFIEIFSVQLESNPQENPANENEEKEQEKGQEKEQEKKKNVITQEYVCLIKDYLAIRKPAIQVFDLVEISDLPLNVKKNYHRILEDFFKRYAHDPSLGDDPEVFNIFINENLLKLIEFLTQNIIKLNNPPKNLVAQIGNKTEYFNAIKLLAERNIVYLAEDPNDPKNPWIILLTDIELQQIFPEYLINGISEELNKERINKDVAIIALNILKNAYIKYEKPALYKETMEKINKLIEQYKVGMEQQNNKIVLKTMTSIISLYKSIGEYKKVKEWEQKLENFNYL